MLTHGQQVASGWIDREPPRLLLSRHAADRREGAAGRVDAEGGQRARGALRGVDESAVRGGVEVGGRRLALEPRGQGADRLFRREPAAPGVVVEHVDGGVELADDVDRRITGGSNGIRTRVLALRELRDMMAE